MQEFERALKHRPEDSSAQRYLRTVQKKLNEERDVAAMREGLKHLSRDLAPSDAGVNLNFPRPPVPHGGPLIFDDSDLNKPLDARQFITQQMYVSAGKHVERLEQQRQALETKLADLKRWRGNLAKEAGAVERLRRDATEGALVEIFQKVPISQALKSLEARKYTNSETVRTLEASWNALNGLLSGAQGISAAERERQVKKVLAGHLSFRKALLAIPQSAPETKKWLEGVSKVYEAGAKVVDYSLKDNAHLWDLAKLVVEIGGVLFPPVALGVFVEGVGEQGAQYWADFVKWLRLYLPMVEEGTWAYIEIGESDAFPRPFPQGVVASAFANRELYVVLANYSHTPVEIGTTDEYFSETSVAPARGKIWKLAARSHSRPRTPRPLPLLR